MAHRRIVVGLTGLAVLVAVAFVGVDSVAGTTTSTSTSTVPTTTTAVSPSTIMSAAARSLASPGITYRLSEKEQTQSWRTVQIVGTGTYSTATRSGADSLTVRAGGRSQRAQDLFFGSTYYLKLPPGYVPALHAPQTWLRVDLSNLPNRYLKSVALLMGHTATNESRSLSYWTDAGFGSVEDLGPATVDGVSATHYRTSIKLDAAAEYAHLPPALRRVEKKLLQVTKFQVVPSNGPLTQVDLWIDGSHLIRRLTATATLATRGVPGTNTATETLDLSYGHVATPVRPPASRTADLLALLKPAS